MQHQGEGFGHDGRKTQQIDPPQHSGNLARLHLPQPFDPGIGCDQVILLSPSSDADFHLAIAAARVGLGAAVTPYPHVAVDLQTGRLVAPYGFVPTPTMYVALSDPGRSTAARTAQFLQWLAARAAKAVPA